ncbi:50S ribosome-binding GTPase [Anaerovibrio lipolyticus]|uniref:GTPase n=1 Tax=Anaerovibrio lipolyticus TaxID=82374 RepID=UPI001F436F81|nr:GTPase [Anaerovibrio lipolyticus]MCF2600641.1 50S ribosome-binding GTPase [Anaerovibrio lipolyticus]
MRELTNYQSILQEKSEVAEGYFCKYPDLAIDEVKRYRDINNTKVKSTLPEIMVYGIFSAGKSSIINELIGDDKARVSEIPETDKITYYDWQGYKLADTPGVDAPIEHEEITKEHLKKADIVLFVMSNAGGYERETNYSRMKDIADAGKKIIIVLNDKTGDLGKHDDTLQLIKQKIDANMRKTGIANIDDRFHIEIVNADRARKGRITNKTALVEMSNINGLKNIILTELKKTSSFDVLRRSIVQMEECLEKFAEEVKAQESSELLVKMNQVLENFGIQKRNIRQQVNTFIDRKTDLLAPEMAEAIWSNRENQDNINKVVGEKLAKLNQSVEEHIQQLIEEATETLDMELKSFVEVKIETSSVDADSLKNILANLEQLNSSLTGEASVNKDLLTDTGDFDMKEIMVTPAVAEMVGSLLVGSGKSVVSSLAKTSIGKAFAGTTIGKMLGSATSSVMPMPPIPGPIPPIVIIEILRKIIKFLGDNDDNKRLEEEARQRNEAARQRLEMEKQARQEINQKCLYWVDNLADELKSAANQAIKETLNTYEEPFRKELENRREQGAERMNDVAALRSLCNEYHQLLVELGGN